MLGTGSQPHLSGASRSLVRTVYIFDCSPLVTGHMALKHHRRMLHLSPQISMHCVQQAMATRLAVSYMLGICCYWLLFVLFHTHTLCVSLCGQVHTVSCNAGPPPPSLAGVLGNRGGASIGSPQTTCLLLWTPQRNVMGKAASCTVN